MKWYRGRYVQLLEQENARLLTENRKLLNIIMPRLGYDPLDAPEPKQPPTEKRQRKPTWSQWAVKMMRKSGAGNPQPYIPRPERKETNGDATKPAA